MVYANGDRYEGDWVDGVRHGTCCESRQYPWLTLDAGSGRFEMVGGDVYVGEWANNKRYARQQQ